MLSAVEKKSDQVYRWLLAYIDENKFSGNQRLPSENALCRKLGVSRETIRVAIDQLVAEGLVYKLKGSGTYFHREKVMTRDLNTCLLYTSPSPRDYAASRMPSSA